MKKTLFLLILFTIAISSRADAYIDPGAGSVAFQVVLASVIAAVFSFRPVMRRIARFFSRKKGDSKNASDLPRRS